jgi:hypothetical protein
MTLTQNFRQSLSPNHHPSVLESLNALETAMAVLGKRMLGRLAAGSTLAEVAADEGLAPRRARELLAEAVARRGYDP